MNQATLRITDREPLLSVAVNTPDKAAAYECPHSIYVSSPLSAMSASPNDSKIQGLCFAKSCNLFIRMPSNMLPLWLISTGLIRSPNSWYLNGLLLSVLFLSSDIFLGKPFRLSPPLRSLQIIQLLLLPANRKDLLYYYLSQFDEILGTATTTSHPQDAGTKGV